MNGLLVFLVLQAFHLRLFCSGLVIQLAYVVVQLRNDFVSFH